MKLTIPQTTALDYLEDKVTREVLFGGAAGPGKSTLGCYWQLKNRLKYPETVGLIGRSTLKTLKETTLQSFHKVCKMQGIRLGEHYKFNDNSNIMTFYNGSRIYWKDLFYYPGDPDCDEFGSYELTDLFIDEASQVVAKIKDVLRSRIRHLLDEFDLVPTSLYTTNPGKNWTKSEFYDKAIVKKLSKNKAFVPAALSSNKYISKFYEENLRGLPRAMQERLLFENWNYNDDPAQLMTTEAIEGIFTNTFVPQGQKKYVTADIARMGKDRIIIRVWAGWRVIQRFEYSKLRITETAEHIKEIAHKYGVPMHNVLCDEDGIGGGVVDILRCKGFIANSRPFDTGVVNVNNKNFYTLKDQCGWWLADQINNNRVFDPTTDEDVRSSIKEELSEIKDATLNKDTKNRLVSKDVISANIGRSPDDSDTMLMRSYFDLNKFGNPISTN